MVQGGPFNEELSATRSRAIQLVAAVLIRGENGVRTDERTGEALAAALVGASESLADWWLDHPEESSAAIASRLMNMLWMGFGNLVDDRIWHPPPLADQRESDQRESDQA
jgi:hypothetical protein